MAIDGVITTAAGDGVEGFGGDDGPSAAARFNRPSALAVDVSENLFIADERNHRIRKVGADGIVTTVVGTGIEDFGGDNGPATAAHLRHPSGVAVDRSGNLLIADTDNHRIRTVGSDGIITTIVGTGIEGFAGDNGPATAAQLKYPSGLSVDQSGNLFIADTDNHRIRRVAPDGTIATVVGGGVTSTTLENPEGVAAGLQGNFFVSDTQNHRVLDVAFPLPARRGQITSQ